MKLIQLLLQKGKLITMNPQMKIKCYVFISAMLFSAATLAGSPPVPAPYGCPGFVENYDLPVIFCDDLGQALDNL